MYLKICTDLLLSFLFNLLKMDISLLMFCTDCKYYLIIWLLKVNSDDEKIRLDQMNQIVWLLLGMKSEINLSFVYIWQSKLDQSALISECLSNSILYHFQVSNSVENDGSMMKKKIVDSTYHWCYWFGRLIWNFSETLYRCLTKKRSRRKPRASFLEKLFIYQVNEMSPVTEHYHKSHITVFLSCVCLLRLGSREFYQNLCQIVMSNHANWCRSFWKMYF